jgi:cytochrome c oxidase assembly protein subunit 11
MSGKSSKNWSRTTMTNRADMGQREDARTRDRRLAAWLVVVPLVMLALSFAAPPFYRLFCQATGINGTTNRADTASTRTIDRMITVRFDTNISPALAWDFRPEKREVRIKIGENALAFFRATNRSQIPLSGTATFNVTPEVAGAYFTKVQCFCFNAQTLAPGETVEMPVSFYVDPAIMNDPEARTLSEITLSYTFFKTSTPAAAAKSGAPGRG